MAERQKCRTSSQARYHRDQRRHGPAGHRRPVPRTSSRSIRVFGLTGRAFTILYGPAGIPPGTVGDYIDDVPPGGVVVLDNGGRENATVWGDILTWVANRRGVAGTVIDGACRDTHLSRELGYPIYSRSYSMRTGKDRIQVEAMGGPVNIGDARVQSRRYPARRRGRSGGDSPGARRRDPDQRRADRRRGVGNPRLVNEGNTLPKLARARLSQAADQALGMRADRSITVAAL